MESQNPIVAIVSGGQSLDDFDRREEAVAADTSGTGCAAMNLLAASMRRSTLIGALSGDRGRAPADTGIGIAAV